ncbi:MAG: hypothetical protein KDB03_06165 [Planctomycetales bacterium]|nr:hypothetical protein [Planctomycetales bacterium]
MSSINFFSWIRDGVRQSVLLGVSDAIEQLGSPPQADELHPSVAGFLQNEKVLPPTTSLGVGATKTNSPSRKRLGKSLKDISSLPTS